MFKKVLKYVQTKKCQKYQYTFQGNWFIAGQVITKDRLTLQIVIYNIVGSTFWGIR